MWYNRHFGDFTSLNLVNLSLCTSITAVNRGQSFILYLNADLENETMWSYSSEEDRDNEISAITSHLKMKGELF